jgi:transcription elongation factor GreA
MKTTYYTEEGYNNLQSELKQLESVERPKIVNAISEARDKGDLSENAEYHAAKEAQSLLETKISKLKEILSNARIMDETNIDTSKVLLLSKVKIRTMDSNMMMEYTLVAENEANLKDKKISVDSPLGKCLLGKSVGDITEMDAPAGKKKFEIMDISR